MGWSAPKEILRVLYISSALLPSIYSAPIFAGGLAYFIFLAFYLDFLLISCKILSLHSAASIEWVDALSSNLSANVAVSSS